MLHYAMASESSSGDILNEVTAHNWPHDVTHAMRNNKRVSSGDQMERDEKGDYMATNPIVHQALPKEHKVQQNIM